MVPINLEMFLALDINEIVNPPFYEFVLVRKLYENQLIFHEETQNFTKMFWTSQLLNKYFSKELGEIYESRYLHM